MTATPVMPQTDTPLLELTPLQNVIVSRLAGRMRAVGVSLMVLATLLVLWAVVGTGGMLAFQAGVVLGLTGWWSARAAAALSRAVKTQGADMHYLMRALNEIAKLYELQYWIFLLVALVLGVTLLMALTGLPWLPEAW